MTSLLPRTASILPDVFGWWDNDFMPFATRHVVRIEESADDGHYVVRAELPGFDPEKEIRITVEDGRLTVQAHRERRKDADGHSEFRYGSFSRTLGLPTDVKEDEITARYDNGILTIEAPTGKPTEERSTEVPITTTESKN